MRKLDFNSNILFAITIGVIIILCSVLGYRGETRLVNDYKNNKFNDIGLSYKEFLDLEKDLFVELSEEKVLNSIVVDLNNVNRDVDKYQLSNYDYVYNTYNGEHQLLIKDNSDNIISFEQEKKEVFTQEHIDVLDIIYANKQSYSSEKLREYSSVVLSKEYKKFSSDLTTDIVKNAVLTVMMSIILFVIGLFPLIRGKFSTINHLIIIPIYISFFAYFYINGESNLFISLIFIVTNTYSIYVFLETFFLKRKSRPNKTKNPMLNHLEHIDNSNAEKIKLLISDIDICMKNCYKINLNKKFIKKMYYDRFNKYYGVFKDEESTIEFLTNVVFIKEKQQLINELRDFKHLMNVLIEKTEQVDRIVSIERTSRLLNKEKIDFEERINNEVLESDYLILSDVLIKYANKKLKDLN